MRAHIKRAIERHALADYPREACGLIVADGNKQRYVPCRNMAEHGQDFQLPADDYAAAEDLGQVLAVVHSHIDRDPMPSEADLVSCEATGLPWYIVAVAKEARAETPVVLAGSCLLGLRQVERCCGA